jgi:D-alanine transaminase
LTVIIHLNGQLLSREHARIDPFDRGFLFGDGVYEGLRTFRGRTVAMDRHIRRLRDGLREAGIRWDADRMERMTAELVNANNTPDAFVYWQITRGSPPEGQPVRSRVPTAPMQPTVFGYCSSQPPIEHYLTNIPTLTASIVPDTRWQRGHLKSISLLGNILAAFDAAAGKSQDAILVRDGLLTEGSATNIILALPGPGRKTQLVTPSLDSVSILGGITRELLVDFIPGLATRAVREEELHQATEIMLVGTTSMVTSVTHLGGRPLNNGQPGPLAKALLRDLLAIINAELALGLDIPAPRIPAASHA